MLIRLPWVLLLPAVSEVNSVRYLDEGKGASEPKPAAAGAGK